MSRLRKVSTGLVAITRKSHVSLRAHTGAPQSIINHCPHCNREWHGLAVTAAIEEMRQQGVYDEEYWYIEDYSDVLCEGSTFIGPMRAESASRPAGKTYVTGRQWIAVFWELIRDEVGRTTARWQQTLWR